MKQYEDIVESYINKGLNIIPVKVDKTPAVDKWVEFQSQKIDLEKFKDLYGIAYRKGIGVGGVAVITGEISGVTIIDFDNGSEDILFGTNTPTVKTGSGGKHYYFKYTNKLKQTANSKLKIDIRNDGGYAIMPPSENKNGKYEWIRNLDTPLAEVPETFIEFYNKGSDKNNTWNKLTDFNGVEEGGRNSKAVSVVGSLINKYRNDLNSAWQLFQGWNLTNKPPLEEEELNRIFSWCVEVDKKNQEVEVKDETKKELYQLEIDELMHIEKREMLKTGVPELDSSFMHPTGYYVICANPGVGKGWWALWLSRKFWLNHQKKSVYFSLEMTTDSIKRRIFQQWSVLNEKDFDNILDAKDYSKLDRAIKMIQTDMFRVDEFGGSDTSKQKPEVFRKKLEEYYKQGFRIFHFDHLHELEGANDNLKNQGVTELWAKTFQSICKDFSDIWLFVFAQPNANASKKRFIEKIDISGSKAITQKCEFFYSLNRKTEIDVESGMPVVVNDDRNVFLFLDKNRITSVQYRAFSLYFSLTGNFLGQSQTGNYLGMFKEE